MARVEDIRLLRENMQRQEQAAPAEKSPTAPPRRDRRFDVNDAHDDSDDDIEEAGELRPEDEALAMVPPMGGVPVRWEVQDAQAKLEQSKKEAAREAAGGSIGMSALKVLWSTEVAEEEEDGDQYGADTFCVRHSPDDKMIATGCNDGVVRIYNVENGRLAYSLDASSKELPSTCLRFRPGSASSSTKNVMLVANCDGTVTHWHITSRRCLHTITEEDNQVYALDYAADAEHFATAGRDFAVRYYDESTKTLISKFETSRWDKESSGHSNRVFALKFAPSVGANADDARGPLLLSAGWDNTVQVWDVRAGRSVMSMWGPHVCGDGLDVSGHTVATASWQPHDQLQLWDLRSGGLLESAPMGLADKDRDVPQLYGCQFGKANARLLAAGGTVGQGGEVRLFSRSSEKCSPIGVLTLPRGVYGVDFSHDGRSFAVVGGDARVHVGEVPAAAR